MWDAGGHRCRAWMQQSHQDSTVCKTAFIAGGKRGVTLVKMCDDCSVGSRVGGCHEMSRETILQTKDLSSGRNPALEFLSKALKLQWKENFFKGINIHYNSWNIVFNQDETWKVWLHLQKDPVCDFLGLNTDIIFLSENCTMIWIARAVWEIDVNSKIELFSPFNALRVLCLFFLSVSRCCPFPPPCSFLVSIVSLDPIYCCICSFWASLLFLSLSVVCQVVSLWKLSDL